MEDRVFREKRRVFSAGKRENLEQNPVLDMTMFLST
jgi:hypothetical protein